MLHSIRSNRSGAIPRGMELLMNTGRYNRDVSTAASLNPELYRGNYRGRANLSICTIYFICARSWLEVVRYYLVRGACRERASNCDDPGNTAVACTMSPGVRMSMTLEEGRSEEVDGRSAR